MSLKVSGSVQQGEVIYLRTTLVSPQKGTSFSPADEAADQAFVAFLLQPEGRKVLRSAGYVLRQPQLVLAPGYKSAAQVLPAPILKLFKALGGTVGS